MKIGLLDIDNHHYPNLALMKISAFHKKQGDKVSFINFFENYDIVYQSKVFTYTPDNQFIINSEQLIKGGTGYNKQILPDDIEHICPDYSIYPNLQSAYGFLTRGCPNKCSWCIVPEKEGKIRQNADIEEFLDGKKSAILMDNNVLASEFGLQQIEKIISLKIKVDFNQGLDARLIDRPIAKLLSKVRWLKPVRLSCDTLNMIKPVKKAMRYLREYNCTPQNYYCNVLVQDIDSAMRRVKLLQKWDLDPFAQPYIDYTPKKEIPHEQERFSRWVNHKPIFNSVKWLDYNRL
jgi:hypothetical protein